MTITHDGGLFTVRDQYGLVLASVPMYPDACAALARLLRCGRWS